PPPPPVFPSPTLFRSLAHIAQWRSRQPLLCRVPGGLGAGPLHPLPWAVAVVRLVVAVRSLGFWLACDDAAAICYAAGPRAPLELDRKSTRLNSSHVKM